MTSRCIPVLCGILFNKTELQSWQFAGSMFLPSLQIFRLRFGNDKIFYIMGRGVMPNPRSIMKPKGQINTDRKKK